MVAAFITIQKITSLNPSTAQVVKSDKVHRDGSPLPGRCGAQTYQTGLLPKFAGTVVPCSP